MELFFAMYKKYLVSLDDVQREVVSSVFEDFFRWMLEEMKKPVGVE
jgi:hypothetical protein